MGIPMSLLGKLGIPGVESLTTDQVYEKYFAKETITDFQKFHIAFINLCNEANTVLPGKHYTVKASAGELEKTFKEWTEKGQSEEDLVKLIGKNITEHKPNEKALIITGLVVPPAASFLKTFQEKPQLKRFRLNLVPNVVFVPACTFLSLVGVRALQIKSTTKS